jgi:hypothetical protein
MSSFKAWILNENIVINDMGTEAVLQVAEQTYIREFNYHWDKGYSTYFIAPYQARRPGYLHLGEHATHIGITKTSPIEAGVGVDVAFIKTLTGILNSKFQSVPYKEGESQWMGLINKAMPDHDITPETDKQLGHAPAPNFAQGNTNSVQITPGIKASRASGSWSFFVKTSSVRYAIESVLNYMKQAAQPLIDNDVIDYFEINERMTGKQIEIVRSKKGQEDKDNHTNEYNKNVAYLKYMAMVILKNKPNIQKLVLNRISGVGMGGRQQHPAAAIIPDATKIPLPQLEEFVNNSYGTDIILQAFLEGAKKDNDLIWNMMEKAATQENPNALMYYACSILRLEGYLNNKNLGNDLGHCFEPTYALSGMNEIINIFKSEKLLQAIIPHQYELFKSRYEKFINDWFLNEEEKEPLEPYEIKKLKAISAYIELDPRLKDNIDKLHGEITKAENDKKVKDEETRRRRSNIFYEGDSKYMLLSQGNSEWHKVPDRYVSYRGDVDMGWFCLEEIVDREDIFHDAYEKAQEKAYEDAEEKKSLTYGDDKNDVESDIESDYDDFINDHELEDEGLENMSDEEAIQLIKDNYFSDFIAWKKEKLEKEEESESWKYEPEVDQNDLNDIEQEIAEEVAYENYGLVFCVRGEKDTTFTLHSKYKEKALPLIKNAVKINMETKVEDDEYEKFMAPHDKISIEYTDDGQYQNSSAYDLTRS